MTAPRHCRSCKAPLPTNVRWCVRCYAPVLEFAPREHPLPPLPNADEPPEWVRRSPLRDANARPPTYSRWRAGPTTFGPLGRVVITLVVLLFFPWDAVFTLNPLRLWFMLAYTIFAVYVLRSTWKRERVVVEPAPPHPRPRRRLSARFPALSRGVDLRLPIAIAIGSALVACAMAWLSADAYVRYATLAVALTAGVALFLARSIED